MNAIKPLAETETTVTLRRSDFNALLDAAEIADDVAHVDARVTQARRDYLSLPEMQTLLDGANRVRFWREKRGVTRDALAAAIGVEESYLAEVETDLKPGDRDFFEVVANFLDLPSDRLFAE